MGLTKDTIRSDRVEDQEALGVIDPLDPKASREGARQAGDAQGRLRQGPGRLHHRQGGQGPHRPAVRPRARPEADLRRQRQGRPLDPVRRLDRDEPAQARHGQGPHGRVRLDQGRHRREPAAARAGRGRDGRPQGRLRPLDDRRQADPGGEGARHREALRADQRPGRPEDRRRPAQARGPDSRAEGERRPEGAAEPRGVGLARCSQGFYPRRAGQAPLRARARSSSRPTRGPSTPSASARSSIAGGEFIGRARQEGRRPRTGSRSKAEAASRAGT